MKKTKYLSTKDKETILNGKRYKVIADSIASQRMLGIEISKDIEIDLHFSYHLTLNEIKCKIKK